MGSQPKVQYPNPGYSAAGQIVGTDLREPLVGAIKDDIINDPFQNQASRQYQQTVSDLRSSYGARGLANSGIAIAGEQKALGDIQANAQAARAGQLTGILGTASSSPSYPNGTQKQPSGFLGLK